MHEQQGRTTDAVISTTAGLLAVDRSEGLLRARGVHYGTAARFGRPLPRAPWPGVVDATARGPVCPQSPSRLDDVTGPLVEGLHQSEDCLVLSVTAPASARNLPVMVWLHGGAYLSGGGEAACYDPDLLVRDGDVVVVTVTYRLGLFGYFDPELPGEGDNGLRDQLLALQWVRANIAAFGGDPERVTVFGQSAGADSALSLLLTPATEGLFRRLVLQSAPLGLRHGREPMARRLHEVATTELGPEPGEVGVDAVLRAQATVVEAARAFGPLGGLPFAPGSGGGLLPAPDDAASVLADHARDVELLIGTTRDDASVFVAMDPRAARVARFGPVGRAAVRRIGARVTERIFRAPAAALARQWRDGGGRAATYRFDWAPPQSPLGACHCLDLPFLLGSPDAWREAPMLGGLQPEHGPGARMREAWARFAHDGASALSEHLVLT